VDTTGPGNSHEVVGRGPAAVDGQQGAGDGGGFVGAEERGEAGDLCETSTNCLVGCDASRTSFITTSSLIPRAFACSGICFCASGVTIFSISSARPKHYGGFACPHLIPPQKSCPARYPKVRSTQGIECERNADTAMTIFSCSAEVPHVDHQCRMLRASPLLPEGDRLDDDGYQEKRARNSRRSSSATLRYQNKPQIRKPFAAGVQACTFRQDRSWGEAPLTETATRQAPPGASDPPGVVGSPSNQSLFEPVSVSQEKRFLAAETDPPKGLGKGSAKSQRLKARAERR
jgi:hypothetical protein